MSITEIIRAKYSETQEVEHGVLVRYINFEPITAWLEGRSESPGAPLEDYGKEDVRKAVKAIQEEGDRLTQLVHEWVKTNPGARQAVVEWILDGDGRGIPEWIKRHPNGVLFAVGVITGLLPE